MIEEVKLIPRKENIITEDLPFNGFSDINYDPYGNWEKCVGDEGLAQNFSKAILTYSNKGYGTFFKKLLGKKNLNFIKGKMLSDVVTSLDTLKKNQLSFLNNFPTYNKKSIVGNLYNLIVFKSSPQNLHINVKLSSLDEENKGKVVLDESNISIP